MKKEPERGPAVSGSVSRHFHFKPPASAGPLGRAGRGDFLFEIVQSAVEIAEFVLERFSVLRLQLPESLGDGNLQVGRALLKRLDLDSSLWSRSSDDFPNPGSATLNLPVAGTATKATATRRAAKINTFRIVSPFWLLPKLCSSWPYACSAPFAFKFLSFFLNISVLLAISSLAVLPDPLRH